MTPIDLATQTAETPISVGSNRAPSPSPPTATAYVSGSGNTVSPIDLGTHTAESPITVASEANGIAFSPDGQTAYVADYGSNAVTTVTTSSGVSGNPINVGSGPDAIAVMPDQAPTGFPVGFDHRHHHHLQRLGVGARHRPSSPMPGTSATAPRWWTPPRPPPAHTYATGVCAGHHALPLL